MSPFPTDEGSPDLTPSQGNTAPQHRIIRSQIDSGTGVNIRHTSLSTHVQTI